ncbi:MAG TPA: HlyD family efflux transporter periplasmic adaptor subunit [Phycisphaerae bacterium]|nr:HlyD family efflux transporter periplasmic adaptor subunit [Phycisphaerae bacterium]
MNANVTILPGEQDGLLFTSGQSRALARVQPRRWVVRVALVLAACFVAGPLLMLFAPWQQNLRGAGRVVAYAPLERQQQIEAPINGRIVRWWVQEGSEVAAGEQLLEISDIDPNLVSRLEQEKAALVGKLAAYEGKVQSYRDQVGNLESTRDLAVAAASFRLETGKQKVRAAEEALRAAQAALSAAEAQHARNVSLLADGIVSRRQFEIAERDAEQARTGVNRAEADRAGAVADLQAAEQELTRIRVDQEAKIDSARAALSDARGQAEDTRASLAKIEVQLARQRSQLVTAPRAGTVFRLVANEGGEIVKAGDPLLTLVPETQDRAVEVWVDGNDAPLVQPGSAVRLQFEGWPAVQFVGWPSVAVGTFGGRVALLDATDDGAGKFRLVVVPDETDEAWPDARYLRQGVRARAWVLLKQVSLGYELWRQLNGFPPVVAPSEPKSDIARKRLK